MIPRAPPASPGGNKSGGIAQKGACIDLVKTPVSTSSAKENQMWRGNNMANQKQKAKPTRERAVHRRGFLVLSDRAPNRYNPASAET
jgi:hypothetical protein